MPDLADGETAEMKGSGAKPYLLKNSGGVYSCSCPAWRNQSTAIERRTCKHLRKLRGDDAEAARLGSALPQKPAATADGEEKPAPALLLAETWDTSADLSGWWMSEKLDGLRAYWDGEQFVSRLGNLFHAPDWFLAGLPAAPLDGELWVGRGQFARASGLVRRQDKTDLWKEVRYLVFDAPAAPGGFEERTAFAAASLAESKPPYAAMHPHELCRGLDHLRAELARVESLGGEGLMLRRPNSQYEAGRSSTLVKVKTFKDAEAVVVGHQAGKGRHAGRVGALLVRLASGAECAVGTGLSDAERSDPPPVGAVITFRYQELTEAGVPRFPSYVGVRHDAAPPVPAARVIDPAVAKAVAASWRRIEGWLKQHAPPLAARLGKPATPEAIARTEAALGVTFPDDVRASYGIHDGDGESFLFQQGDYLSLDGVLGQYGVWRELVETGEIGDDKSEPTGPIRTDWYNLKWVPITHNGGGDHALLDLAPAKGGRVGQVIDFGHEYGAISVLAPSFADYLARLAADFEAGRVVYDGQYLEWRDAPEPPTTGTPAGVPDPADSPTEKDDSVTKKRYFEFVEGTSNKFWEVSHEGTEMTTRYGKIGTDGRATTKSYATPEKAAEEAAKITATKVKEGYVEKTQ